jgi:hypothetical protein
MQIILISGCYDKHLLPDIATQGVNSKCFIYISDTGEETLRWKDTWRLLNRFKRCKSFSPSQYQYSNTSLNTNLNIQDKVRWQVCDLKPLHKVLFVCLVLFFSLCIKFLQQGVQVYLKHTNIYKFWELHWHTGQARKQSKNSVLTLWHLTLYFCNTQCDAQKVKCYILMAALIQPLFKWWPASDHTLN